METRLRVLFYFHLIFSLLVEFFHNLRCNVNMLTCSLALYVGKLEEHISNKIYKTYICYTIKPNLVHGKMKLMYNHRTRTNIAVPP